MCKNKDSCIILALILYCPINMRKNLWESFIFSVPPEAYYMWMLIIKISRFGLTNEYKNVSSNLNIVYVMIKVIDFLIFKDLIFNNSIKTELVYFVLYNSFNVFCLINSKVLLCLFCRVLNLNCWSNVCSNRF